MKPQGLEIEEKMVWKWEETRHATKQTRSVFFLSKSKMLKTKNETFIWISLPNIGNKGALELDEALVFAAPTGPAVVLEGAVQWLLLGVEQDRHPLVPVVLRLGLEMVRPEIERWNYRVATMISNALSKWLFRYAFTNLF